MCFVKLFRKRLILVLSLVGLSCGRQRTRTEFSHTADLAEKHVKRSRFSMHNFILNIIFF